MSVFSLTVQIHALTKFERISIHISLTAEISKIPKLAKTNIPNPKKLRHIHQHHKKYTKSNTRYDSGKDVVA